MFDSVAVVGIGFFVFSLVGFLVWWLLNKEPEISVLLGGGILIQLIQLTLYFSILTETGFLIRLDNRQIFWARYALFYLCSNLILSWMIGIWFWHSRYQIWFGIWSSFLSVVFNALATNAPIPINYGWMVFSVVAYVLFAYNLICHYEGEDTVTTPVLSGIIVVRCVYALIWWLGPAGAGFLQMYIEFWLLLVVDIIWFSILPVVLIFLFSQPSSFIQRKQSRTTTIGTW